jgi:hypothetical protein
VTPQRAVQHLRKTKDSRWGEKERKGGENVTRDENETVVKNALYLLTKRKEVKV